MNRPLSWTVALFALLMGACQTVPPQQTTKVSISPKLARLYLQKVRSENELSSEVFNPANYASDDPDGNKRYVLAYMTRKQDVDMVLLTQLDRIIPYVWKLDAAEAARTRALLDELQKRFGITSYAMSRMGWPSDQQLEYVKRHGDYGVTRWVRYSIYDPEQEVEKRKRGQWYPDVPRNPDVPRSR